MSDKKTLQKILDKNKEANRFAAMDMLEYGYYIEDKNGKRIKPLTEEWWNALEMLSKEQTDAECDASKTDSSNAAD